MALSANRSGVRNSKFSKVMTFAYRSILQHKLRASLSVIGIIFGVTAVIVMLSISEGAKRESLKQIEKLGTRNIYVKAVALTESQGKRAVAGRSGGLQVSDAERIKGASHRVTEVAYTRDLRASVMGMSREMMPQVEASSSNYMRVLSLSLHQGRFISEEDVARKNLVCVIGHNVAKKIGNDGRKDGHVRINDTLFKIVGVLKKYGEESSRTAAIAAKNFNDMILLPIGAENVLNDNLAKTPFRDNLSELIVQAERTEDVIRVGGIVARTMELTHGGVDDYQMITPLSLLQQLQRTQTTFNIVFGTIAGISLLTGGIGIMNMMLTTVTERTKEVGVRRAVGATREDIVAQFIAESALLTFSGGMIGIVSGILGALLISGFADWKIVLTPFVVLVPLLMAVVTGGIFGLYPAYKAAQMEPIKALKYE